MFKKLRVGVCATRAIYINITSFILRFFNGIVTNNHVLKNSRFGYFSPKIYLLFNLLLNCITYLLLANLDNSKLSTTIHFKQLKLKKKHFIICNSKTWKHRSWNILIFDKSIKPVENITTDFYNCKHIIN